MAEVEADASGGGIVSPVPVRYWPREQEIRLGYRLIGDYETLLQRLRASRPRGLGAYWEQAFDSIAEVDVEALLLNRIAHFAELTGLSITPERYGFFDRWSPFDMCIEIYLSDRQEDLTSFPCLEEMQERLASVSRRTDAFITWGWAGTYATETNVLGAACLATYSAFTFQMEIRRDRLYANIGRSRDDPTGIWAPFFELSGETTFGQISGSSLGFFGRIREITGRADRRDNTPACRQTLRETYRRQMTRIVDNCLASMLGLPISDVGPTTLMERADHPPIPNLRRLSLLDVGSSSWVEIAGSQTAAQHQETPRLRLLEQHAEALLTRLYGNEMTAGELHQFAQAELEMRATTALDRGEVPSRGDLFKLIEEDCLGPD